MPVNESEHVIKLTPGVFRNGVQEPPWQCIHCLKYFRRRPARPGCCQYVPGSILAIDRITRGGRMSGWGSFKHALMRELGIPEDQFGKWNVPQDWIDAYKEFYGR